MDVFQGAEQVEMRSKWKARWLVLPTLTLCWLGMVSIGLSWMWQYQATPGEATARQVQWPNDSRIERNQDRPTLVLFAHPRCPCTRATIGELGMIVARCRSRVDVHVLFFKPSGFSADWANTDIWRSAEAIPGVNVVCDEDGLEAKKFGATTSGYTLLYSQQGALQFDGGITASRGHLGDNLGRTAIESIVMSGQSEQQQQTFVFGCPLLGRDDACGIECRK